MLKTHSCWYSRNQPKLQLYLQSWCASEEWCWYCALRWIPMYGTLLTSFLGEGHMALVNAVSVQASRNSGQLKGAGASNHQLLEYAAWYYSLTLHCYQTKNMHMQPWCTGTPGTKRWQEREQPYRGQHSRSQRSSWKSDSHASEQ